MESIEDLKFIVPNIVCTKLAKKNRRSNFVSFKLDVPRHHYDIIVNPTIWHVNGDDKITVNEFIDKRKALGQRLTENKINPFSMPPTSHHRNQNNIQLSLTM